MEPIEVVKPDDFPLEKCFLMNAQCRDANQINEANIHLLAALGEFDSPFIPIEISSDYKGYTWAQLPTIDQVNVAVGKKLCSQDLWQGRVTAVENLNISVKTSDGREVSSDMPIAIREYTLEHYRTCRADDEVLVTLKARQSVDPNDLWYHLGGYFEDGDTYDTQLGSFREELELFWAEIIGPGEYLRTRLLDCMRDFNLDWQTIMIDSGSKLTITRKDGQQDVFDNKT